TVGPLPGGLDGELENRAIEPDVADGELGRMHADRQAARTGIDIVAADRALRLLVELAVGPERQRMGGNDRALPQQGEDRWRQVAPMEKCHVIIVAFPPQRLRWGGVREAD